MFKVGDTVFVVWEDPYRITEHKIKEIKWFLAAHEYKITGNYWFSAARLYSTREAAWNRVKADIDEQIDQLTQELERLK